MNRRDCKYCGQPIRVERTPTGRYVALDARPSLLNGSIVLARGVARLLGHDSVLRARAARISLYVAHDSWCPEAPAHRRMHAHQPLVAPAGGPRQLELVGV